MIDAGLRGCLAEPASRDASFLVDAASGAGLAGPGGGEFAPGRGDDACQAWLAAPDVPLDLNGPADPFTRLEETFSDTSAIKHLEEIAAVHGSKLAVSDGLVSLNYSELLVAVKTLALAMIAAVPEAEAIGLLLGNCTWYPVAMLAAMASGRPAVSLNPRDPPQRLAEIFADARLSAIVCDQAELAQKVTEGRGYWIDPARSLDSAASGDLATLPRPPSVDAPALVLYTSGSTGAPKGIVSSQRGILERVRQSVNACHIGPGDVFMPLTGPATIAGCREMLTSILSGATLYLVDIENAGIRSVRQLIQSRGVTVTYVVPALMRVLMKDAQPGTFSSFRIVRVGGEMVLWSDIDVVRQAVGESCFIQVSYSSTETTGTQWFLPRDYPESGATVPVGYLVPRLDYAVLDEDGHAVPPGGEGELWVRSRHTTIGHWENGRVAPLPLAPEDPERRIFATEDFVRIDEDGLTWIVGRKGRLVKIHGRRVEPAELELLLRRSPGVRDAVVIVTADNEIVAFVIPEPRSGPDIVSVLRTEIRASLPAAVHPTRLHCVADIPRLRGGKVNSAALRKLDGELTTRVETPEQEPADDIEPANDIEQVVAQVWRAVLNRGTAAGRWDEAGGDSLKLLQFVMEIEARLGMELGLEAFTIDMSFPDIVRAIAASGSGEAADDVGAGLPILFMLPGSIGYGPSLAAFGVEMGDVARVVAVRYPDLVDMLAGNESISVMADLAFEQIRQAQPEGGVALIGYSLGGAVAFEVAERLIASGRPVLFLGILDTNIAPLARDYRETISRTIQRIQSHRMTLDRLLCRSAAKMFVRLRREAWLAEGIERMTSPFLAKMRFLLRLELEDVLRMRAFWRWIAPPKSRLAITATLFRCDRQHMSHDLGWSRLFDRLDVISIAGGHLDMLIDPYLDHNRPLIRKAFVAEAEGATATGQAG